MADAKYLSFMGRGPKRIPHWEHWSDPDAETYLTGIDYYEHPRQCRQRLAELYPQLGLGVPESVMCVGNHIPWNVPGEAVKRYLDLSAELAHR